MKNISIGRQPILNSDLDLCSYEVLYRGSQKVMDRFTSASIINNVLNKFGTKALLGERRAFIKIDEKFLLHDIIFSIPGEFFVFSLLADVEMNERVVERIEQLHEKGYLLSIDDVSLDTDSMYKYDVIKDRLGFMKINIKETTSEIKLFISKLQESGITIVANNIDTQEEYEKAKEFGCQWFQGYFFAKPKIVENAKYEPTQMAVLKLYNLLMQDVNIDEITREFEINHEITLQLLQFINSGAFHFKNKISSIHHVLTLVGRIPLGQWLMLMIYSKSVSKEGQSPLMLMVKHRTDLMENILTTIKPDAGSNMLGEAYFVGVLSLIDTLFGVEEEKILKDMNVSKDVEDAILREKGVLGEIFHIVKEIENFNIESVYEFEEHYKLQIGTIETIMFQSMKDVNSFEKPLSA